MMIKALRLRLTCVFTALLSLVLIGAMSITFCMAAEQYKMGEQLRQSGYMSAVTEKLSAKTAVKDKWLALQETSAHAVIYIEDGGIPLHFKGSYLPKTPREELIQKAKNSYGEFINAKGNTQRSANAAGIEPMAFDIDGVYGDEYKTLASHVEQADGKMVTLYFIFYTAHVKADLFAMLTAYFAITAFGIVLICAISWFLIGLATRPTVKAMARQSEFVAAAGHELRSPLAVITASLQAADGEGLLTEKARAFISTALSEAGRMARLTEDLLLLANGDANALRLEKQKLQLDTLCIELYERFHTLALQKGHTLELQLPDLPLATIIADKERLLQLLSVLVTNAIDHTKDGTAIKIIAVQNKSNVKIAVSDNGQGIAEDDKEKIFTRFYKADKSRGDKAHFGLGLSIARDLAKQHKAKLELVNSDGEGTCFTLTLPI